MESNGSLQCGVFKMMQRIQDMMQILRNVSFFRLLPNISTSSSKICICIKISREMFNLVSSHQCPQSLTGTAWDGSTVGHLFVFLAGCWCWLNKTSGANVGTIRVLPSVWITAWWLWVHDLKSCRKKLF